MNYRKLLSLLGVLLLASYSFAGTIVGKLSTPTSHGPILNATINFSLNAPNTKSGSFLAVTAPVSCFTNGTDGSIVGVPDPQVLPVASSNLASGTLTAGVYYLKLSYWGVNGESAASPELSFSLTGTGSIVVNPPVSQPASASGWKLYIGSSPGSETLQQTITGFGNATQSTPLSAGSSPLANNSSSCVLTFQDEFLQSPSWYAVSITQGSRTLSGISRTGKAAFYGGPGGITDVSSGLPDYDGRGVYSSPVLTNPGANAKQVINGPIDLNGFGLLNVGSFSTLGLTLKGATSGSVTFSVPAVAGSTTAAFPAVTGNVVIDSAAQTLSLKTFVAPVLGAATGTSLALGGGSVLSTTNQSGTGSLCMVVSCVMTTPNIGAATGSSLALTGNASGVNLTATGQVLSNGSLSAPAHSYASETGSGWFLQQAGIQGFARQGVYVLQVNGAVFSFASGYSVSFSSGAPNAVSPDVGISRFGVNSLAIGNSAAGDASGTLRVARVNAVRFAANFAGADCGSKINAASADLAGPGEIFVDQLCGTSWATAITTTTAQVIRIIQGGTYTTSGIITLGQAGGLVGPGCGGNLCAVVLQAGNSTNLAELVLANNQSFISGIELDGNKANNPTGGVGISANQKQQVRITNALIQNFKSHGVDVRSTLSGDEAAVPIIENSLIAFNDGNGLNCVNTSDGFMGRAQFEQNGIGALGATATVVNVSGTAVTWVSGPKWSADSTLVGNFIKFTGTTTTNFIVSSIASTTSMTLTSSAGTLTGTTLLWGHGVEAQDCPGWRYEHSDFGGNGNDGMLLHGTSTGRGSGQNMIVGNEWGSNHAHEFEMVGFTGAYTVADNTLVGNVFLGSSISPANTFSDIFIVDGTDDTITGNVFRPANKKFGVDFEESAAGRTQTEVMTGNSFIPGFGTGAFSTNTTNFGANLKIYANAEGTSGPSTFGSGPTSIKFQGGIAQGGTGLMHFRGTSCTTSAVANGSCTSTITWPGTWNDTSYTATCSLVAPSAAAGVSWLGAKTTTTLQIQILNLAGSASASSGEIDCVAIHD